MDQKTRGSDKLFDVTQAMSPGKSRACLHRVVGFDVGLAVRIPSPLAHSVLFAVANLEVVPWRSKDSFMQNENVCSM